MRDRHGRVAIREGAEEGAAGEERGSLEEPKRARERIRGELLGGAHTWQDFSAQRDPFWTWGLLNCKIMNVGFSVTRFVIIR